MRRFKALFLFLALLGLGSPLAAAIWYVNATAPGGGNGTSLATAWNNIQAATNFSGPGEPAPGDFVYIEPGNYNQGSSIQINDSGTVGNPITFEKDPGAGAGTVFVGDTAGYAGYNIFEFFSHSYVTLENMTIEGSSDAGVSIQSSGAGISIINCIFQNFSGNNAYGVDANTFGAGSSLSQVIVSGSTFTNFNNSTGGYPAKIIALEGNISNSQVTNNTITNSSAFYNGIDIDCDGGAPSNILVSGNSIVGLAAEGGVNGCVVCAGAGIFLDGATYSTVTANSLGCTNGWGVQVGYTVDGPGTGANYNVISNNIIFGSYQSAFNVGTFGAGSGSASHNSFLNNTLFENSTNSSDGEIAIWSGNMPSTQNVFANNVVWPIAPPGSNTYITEGSGGNAPTNTTFNYNDYWSNTLASGAFVYNSTTFDTLANWQTSGGENTGNPDPNSFSSNPDFTITPGTACGGVVGDFIPLCSSPLVNAGENEAVVPVDYIGHSRPVSVHWTIGAYEIAPCGSTPTDTPTWSPSPTYSSTATPSASPSMTASPSASATATSTYSATPTRSPSPSSTDSPSMTATKTSTATPSISPSLTPSATPSNSFTGTPSFSATPSSTASATATSSATASATPTSTFTVTNSPSFSATPSASDTPSATPSASASASPTPTYSSSPSASATASFTNTPSSTPSASITLTSSPTNSFTGTPSETPSPSATSSQTASPSATASATQTSTFTPTSSFTISPTPSASPTITQTPVPMPFQLTITIYNEAGEIVRTLFSGSAEVEANQISLSGGTLAAGSTSINVNLGPNNQVNGQGSLTWNGANDQGQSVSPGEYYVQLSFKDSFGRITTVTNPVQVLPGGSQSLVQIFNSAGELVYQEDVSIRAPGAQAISGPDSFLPPSTATGGQNLVMQIKNGQGTWVNWPWNGRNSEGQIVGSGNYLIKLSTTEATGEVTMSKNITVIDGPENFVDPAPQIAINPLSKGSDLFVRYQVQSGNHAYAALFTLSGEKVKEVSDEGGTGTLDFGPVKAASGIYMLDFEYWQGPQLLERKILKLAILK